MSVHLRVLAAGAVLLTAVLGPASAAAADAGRPTNVPSRVTAVEPASSGIGAAVVGGSAFLRVSVPTGVEVLVPGYDGEPYLRFDRDGTVEVNDRSPTRYLNDAGYSTLVRIPFDASKDAEPSWRVVGYGSYAWHDHRAHWMGAGDPPDPVDWVVPLTVDGRPGAVRGRYEAVPAPASWPWWLTVVVAAGALVLAGWWWPAVPAVAAAVVSVPAFAVALALARGPGESGVNPWVGPVLCAAALAASVAALALRRIPWARGPLLAGAGVALTVWAVRRVDVWSHAVLVTDLPAWFDRGVTAAALATGIAAAVVGAAVVLRGSAGGAAKMGAWASSSASGAPPGG